MTSSQPADAREFPPSSEDFSLVLGGPLFHLLRRAHISGGGLELLRRRTITIALAAWLPLLLLSLLEGVAFGGHIAVPFVQDIEAHVRFLVVLPLLVVAELVVHERLRAVVQQFRARDVVQTGNVARFDAAIAAAYRLRNSVPAELLLIAIVYVVGVPLVWRQNAALTTATWFVTPVAGGSELTLSGWWYGWVSVPIFQFLLLRWYFRILVWVRFLWHVSRIPLHLVPTHPDRLGGLGFLANSAHAFIPLAMAHGALLSGWIGNRIFHLGAKLLDYKIEIVALVVLLLLLVFLPLLAFAPRLARTKREGLREYGTLVSRYVREFEAKWLRGGAVPGDQLLGSGDVQSLADIDSAFGIVREMRLALVSRDAVMQIALAALLPIAPLLLSMMSLEELLRRLFGVMF